MGSFKIIELPAMRFSLRFERRMAPLASALKCLCTKLIAIIEDYPIAAKLQMAKDRSKSGLTAQAFAASAR